MEIQTVLEKKTFNGFLLYHHFKSIAGVFEILFCIASAVALVWKWNMWTMNQRGILFVLIAVFAVIQPLMLVRKGKKQLKAEGMDKPFTFNFMDNSIKISHCEESVEFAYDDLKKIVYRKDIIYVYTTPIAAFLIPRNQVEDKFEEIVSLLKGHRK